MSPLLQVEGLEFSYGRVQILFGISFHLDKGESLALLGTNGAGKSTLLRAVAGLAQPSAGRVVFDDVDVTGMDAPHLVAQGLVLIQGGHAVFPDMNVAENLDMAGFSLRRQPELVKERTDVVLETFPRLKQRWRQLAGTMSGGEQQQLALAKGFILNPSLLCIDELSLGLSPAVVQELLESVKTLRASGTSLLVVEQSLTTASALCERAVFLEKGEVRFEGNTADLLERSDIARAVFLGGAKQGAA